MTDWSRWSREAVALMQSRNDGWEAQYQLRGTPYHWSLDSATIRFHRSHDNVVASICLVGTTSENEGTFLWAWASETIPPNATRDLALVRQFGVDNDLPLLTEPAFEGGRAEALEVLAIAGRVLDAEGVFVSPGGDVTCYFVLRDFRVEV